MDSELFASLCVSDQFQGYINASDCTKSYTRFHPCGKGSVLFFKICVNHLSYVEIPVLLFNLNHPFPLAGISLHKTSCFHCLWTDMQIMTPNPECATVDTPIVDALHTMHDGKFLHLPVVDRGILIDLMEQF